MNKLTKKQSLLLMWFTFSLLVISLTSFFLIFQKNNFSETDARKIAEATCIKGGQALEPGVYDRNSQTWSYGANLNATREGCSPVCLVKLQTKTAEINWQCTSLVN